MTQEYVGNFLNVANTTVSGWETGKDTIPLKKLILYCNKFNFSLDYIFGLSKTNNYSSDIKINLIKIGNNIKRIRIKNNITQEQLADILNTNHSLISYYENGLRLINTSFLYEIAKKFNCSIDNEIFK
jgi:transcriptional regulator with XRE-family HTH domain